MNRVFIKVPKDVALMKELLLANGVRLRKGINHHTGVRNVKPTPEISDALESLEKNYVGKAICARIASVKCLPDARYCELEVTNMTLDASEFQKLFFDYMNAVPNEEPKRKRGRKKTVIVIHEKITRIVIFNPEK